eukprot:6127658-Prymnesium_polylepis.2
MRRGERALLGTLRILIDPERRLHRAAAAAAKLRHGSRRCRQRRVRDACEEWLAFHREEVGGAVRPHLAVGLERALSQPADQLARREGPLHAAAVVGILPKR